MEEGVGPEFHVLLSQKAVESSVTFVISTGDELLDVKDTVWVTLGPPTIEVTVIDGGVAIKVGVEDPLPAD